MSRLLEHTALDSVPLRDRGLGQLRADVDHYHRVRWRGTWHRLRSDQSHRHSGFGWYAPCTVHQFVCTAVGDAFTIMTATGGFTAALPLKSCRHHLGQRLELGGFRE